VRHPVTEKIVNHPYFGHYSISLGHNGADKNLSLVPKSYASPVKMTHAYNARFDRYTVFGNRFRFGAEQRCA
jgi:hypothetical protein